MTKKERYILHQKGNCFTLIDKEENVPLIMIEFKENEFPVYACFHRIIDLLNEKDNLIEELLWQFDELGYNTKTCRDCIFYAKDINYCTMYDMDVKASDIVVRCEDREIIVKCKDKIDDIMNEKRFNMWNRQYKGDR